MRLFVKQPHPAAAQVEAHRITEPVDRALLLFCGEHGLVLTRHPDNSVVVKQLVPRREAHGKVGDWLVLGADTITILTDDTVRQLYDVPETIEA